MNFFSKPPPTEYVMRLLFLMTVALTEVTTTLPTTSMANTTTHPSNIADATNQFNSAIWEHFVYPVGNRVAKSTGHTNTFVRDLCGKNEHKGLWRAFLESGRKPNDEAEEEESATFKKKTVACKRQYQQFYRSFKYVSRYRWFSCTDLVLFERGCDCRLTNEAIKTKEKEFRSQQHTP